MNGGEEKLFTRQHYSSIIEITVPGIPINSICGEIIISWNEFRRLQSWSIHFFVVFSSPPPLSPSQTVAVSKIVFLFSHRDILEQRRILLFGVSLFIPCFVHNFAGPYLIVPMLREIMALDRKSGIVSCEQDNSDSVVPLLVLLQSPDANKNMLWGRKSSANDPFEMCCWMEVVFLCDFPFRECQHSTGRRAACAKIS